MNDSCDDDSCSTDSSRKDGDATPCSEFHIVGVGASAGGLEALEEFFRAIPPDSGLAFVVIQHLSPDFKSHMEELLGRQTSLPVQHVENGISVQPNSIYLIPAGKEMVISGGKLLLTERSQDRSNVHPVDTFMRSLAADVGRYAIGVILSGTGSDGSRGVRDIHAAGGLVIAQDDESAKFDGMPISARETGCVDVVLPPAAIADAVVRYTQEGLTREKLAEQDLAFGKMEEELQILHLLRRKTSVDFSQYKSSTVGRRINRRMQLTRCEDLAAYVQRLLDDDQELNELYKDLLIGVTRFFRDVDAFETLRDKVLAKLVKSAPPDRPIRIWVAACASGEEAYSIAILMEEEIRRQDAKVDFKIFATDAHQGSLHAAAKGCFSAEKMDDVSQERLAEYFTQSSDGYQVTRELRNKIVFAPHNLIDDAPFTQMDLVTCRNMLIYLQPMAQSKVLSLFHFSLKADGYLFLGPSETPGDIRDEFRDVDKRWRIYSKRRDVRLPVDTRLIVGRRSNKLSQAPAFVAAAKTNRVDQDLVRTYDQLLSKKMGCSILVSESGEMLHVFGGAERFLQPRGGRPSTHLLESVHESLRLSISTAWHHALTKREVVRYASTAYTGESEPKAVRLTLTPLTEEATQPCNVLIEFLVMDESMPTAYPPADSSREQHAKTRMDSLETELRYSQENLQATIEEMETSNEELQAANEELIASNEELQSTNEELHSVNEELYTVNAEHQRRVEELAEANDDMDNLLATTRVGVIFLDRGLYLRRFTPEIAKVFNLSTRDTGRSIESFVHVLTHSTLVDDLNEVLHDQQEREFTTQDKSGTPYLVRVAPYQRGDATQGLVLTLIDITTLSEARSEIQLQQLAIETAVNGIIITDPRLEGNPITYANQGFVNLTGYDRDEILGRNCKFLQGKDTDPKAVQKIREALGRGDSIRTTLLNYRKNGEAFWNDLQISPVHDDAGNLVNFVGVQHDITDQVRSQMALEEANEANKRANEAKNAFLATVSHELRTPMTAILGFAEILRTESDDPDFVSKVDTIHRNGTYLLALLNDILDLSKIEAGKLNFERDRIEMRRVMTDIETLMNRRAEDAKVPLRFDYPTPLPTEITADEVRIRQILVNLISNALKFTESGEVVVRTTVNQTTRPPAVEVCVQDTGIGISPSQMQRLFQPFNQASKLTTRRFGGTGLGLSISRRLAEGMGGTIRVESELGKGSRFTLALPISQNDIESMTHSPDNVVIEPSATTESHSHRLTNSDDGAGYPNIDARILLADDRRDVWMVGKFFLERCGARVTIAENGRDAIEAVHLSIEQDDPYALILMDMQMPIMDGRKAVASLRKEGITTPIIALTADAMDGERDSCIAMGCDEYCPKPIDGPRLMKMIADLIGVDAAEQR
jgi:two-component system, chemotaxis family, CheB/CheR fusion protein